VYDKNTLKEKEISLNNYLLTRKELAELERQHKKHKRRNDADRIKAVYLLGSGWSIADVKKALLLSDDTIRRYFSYYKDHGLDNLLKNKHLGMPSRLTDTEKQLLATHLEEHTYAKASEIIAYVEKEFDTTYSESGIRLLLKQLNFVYKKPEKIPFKILKEAQEEFIKFYLQLKKELTPGDGVYFMDATHPEHTPIPSYGWMKRGTTKVVKSNPRPYRLNINGAINIDTLEMIVAFENKIDKESIKDFIEALRKHQPKGWIHLICDNAGYYISPEVQELAKAMAINIIYLPAYSPNLNLIERIWKFFKKKVLYNKYYDDFPSMIRASKRFFSTIGIHQDELKTLMTEKFQRLAI
jgi:transposase